MICNDDFYSPSIMFPFNYGFNAAQGPLALPEGGGPIGRGQRAREISAKLLSLWKRALQQPALQGYFRLT